MAVTVSEIGGTAKVGTPHALFSITARPGALRWFDVSPDGQHFVVNELPEEIGSAPLAMVLNWAALVKQ
jgi:hypothetical protein